MNEVVGHIDTVERRSNRTRISSVGLDSFYPRDPRVVPQPLRRAAHASHVESGVEELWHQPATDVTGRAGDQAAKPAVIVGHQDSGTGEGAGEDLPGKGGFCDQAEDDIARLTHQIVLPGPDLPVLQPLNHGEGHEEDKQ